MSNIFITLEKDGFGCFKIKGECESDNETSLKEVGVIEIETTVLHLRVLDKRERDKERGVIEMSTAVLHSRCSLLRFRLTYNRCINFI